MKLSVIIPVYQAQATLARALDSLPQRAGVELILCIDDGVDYVIGRTDALVLRSPSPKSGPGPVRNRCIKAARGSHVMFLDADDAYTAGSIDTILEQLNVPEPPDLLFPHMMVKTEGGHQLAFTQDLEQLTLDDLATRPFTYHPVVRRDWAGGFSKLVAQDVDHAAKMLAMNGGSAPLVDGACYSIFRQPAERSVSRNSDYGKRIDEAYRAYAKDSPYPEVAQMFNRRIAFNQRYLDKGQGQDFYEFWLKLQHSEERTGSN